MEEADAETTKTNKTALEVLLLVRVAEAAEEAVAMHPATIPTSRLINSKQKSEPTFLRGIRLEIQLMSN